MVTRQQTQQFASQQELRARTDINQIVAARERQQAIQQQQQKIEAQRQQVEEQRKQAEEQQKINSPEFQQSAYKGALRIIQSGYGVQGLPSNNDAFSQAVRTYFYKIQKNPELYQQTRMGDTAFKSYAKANPELFFPYQPAQQQAQAPPPTSVTITPESRVSELLKQGLTSGQIWTAAKDLSAQRIAAEKMVYSPIQQQFSFNQMKITNPAEFIKTNIALRKEAEAIQRDQYFQKFGFFRPAAESISNAYTQSEQWLSPIVTKTIENPAVIGKMLPYEEAIKTKHPILPNTNIYFPNPPREVYEFIRGEITEVKQKPVKTAGMYAAWFAASGALGLAGEGIAKIGAKTGITTALSSTKAITMPVFGMAKLSPSQIWTGAKVIGATALTTAYGKNIYQKVTSYPVEERAFQFGRIASGEIQPMVLGSALGTITIPEIKGYVRTIGRTEIPRQQLIPSDVDIMGGKNRFPLAPTSQHYNLFTTKSQRIPEYPFPTMYHSTGSQFWKSGKGFEVIFTPEMKTSEYQGLFGSYGVSPYFLRIGGQNYRVIGTDFLPATPKPATAAIIPKKFIAGSPIGGKAGIGYIPMNKEEVQAVLTIGTKALPLSQDYFYTIEGVRIPIDVFKAVGEEQASKFGFKNLVKVSSYAESKSSLLNPSYFGISSLISKPSKPSSYSFSSISPSSKQSLSKVSIISPSKPSKAAISPVSLSSISQISKPSLSYVSSAASNPSISAPSSVSRPSTSSIISPPSSPPYDLYAASKAKPIFKKGKRLVKGYKLFVKRFGKFRAMEGIFPRYKAIRLGEERAMKTLARTFKIVKTKNEILDISPKESEYNPSEKIFRGYKIRQGKQIPLKNEWIQRSRFSLSSGGERREIQMFKKSKQRKFSWL